MKDNENPAINVLIEVGILSQKLQKNIFHLWAVSNQFFQVPNLIIGQLVYMYPTPYEESLPSSDSLQLETRWQKKTRSFKEHLAANFWPGFEDGWDLVSTWIERYHRCNIPSRRVEMLRRRPVRYQWLRRNVGLR